MSTLCFDYDFLLYRAGAKGEERSIKAVHRASGDEYEFSTRTAFYGHWKKKAGGWLAEWNKQAPEDQRRNADEFDIIDIQTPEPFENVAHTMKQMIVGITEQTGVKKYYGYTGRGKVFREDVSTVIKYKGNRDDVLRPLHLDNLKDYILKKHNASIVTKIEADDQCTMDTHAGWYVWKKSGSDKDKVILVYSDKDYRQGAGHLHHADSNTTHSQGEVFGSLWLEYNETQKCNEVKGWGRMWLYHQVMYGDDADNYFANSANPEMKWGPIAAYEVLKDAKNDKEAFEALVKGYKTLYPMPKKIVGWRGDEIEVDWLYMLQENFTLAKMLRYPDDRTDVKAVLNKLGVEYE